MQWINRMNARKGWERIQEQDAYKDRKGYDGYKDKIGTNRTIG